MEIGEVYPSNNCGDVKVIEYVDPRRVRVKFLNTGTEVWHQATCVKLGRMKDYNYPSVCGIGYMGYGSYSNKSHKSIYRIWNGILNRCYNPKNKGYHNYGGIGVTICERWKNFQEFAKWYLCNYPQDGKMYVLDKDLLSGESKIYSPDTCCFLSQEDNIRLARAKRYEMRSPSGEIIVIYNMSQFCRDNNLNPSHMRRVYNGLGNHHKGWTRAT